MEIPAFAPGCFGSAITFNASDAICQHCPFKEQCQPAHVASMERLRAAYGIKLPKKKPNKQAVDPVTGESIMTPSSKAQALTERLDKSTLGICDKLKNKVNPFAKTGPKYLDLLCRFLLIKPITNDYLVAAYMQKFDWKQDTAKTHARIATQALEHIGAIRRIDGVIHLKVEG